MRYTIESAVRSNIGKVRKNNEDNFFLDGTYMKRKDMDRGDYVSDTSQTQRQIYAVCDGMGGENNGEDASYCAVERLQRLQAVLDAGGDVRSNIDAFTDETNRAILSFGQSGHMGTTIVMLCFNEGGCEVAHLGDSRAYLLRDGLLVRLTEDHTEVNRLKKLGLITEEEAENHPDRNMISKYLGMTSTDVIVKPEYSQYVPRVKDKILICSDGVYDMVPDSDIAYILMNSRTSVTACKNIVSRALAEGGRDNITAMVLSVRKAEGDEHASFKGSEASVKRKMRAARVGGNWYNEDPESAKEVVLTSGGSGHKLRNWLIACFTLLGLVLIGVALLFFAGGIPFLDKLLGNNIVDNSVTIVDRGSYQDTEEQSEENELPAQSELPIETGYAIDEETLKIYASSFVNEIIEYGLTSYGTAPLTGDEKIGFVFNYLRANVKEYSYGTSDLPSVVSAGGNKLLWVDMNMNGAYEISLGQLDGALKLYFDSSMDITEGFQSAIYSNGFFYLPEPVPTMTRREARLDEGDVAERDADGNMNVSFSVYDITTTAEGEFEEKTADGNALLSIEPNGRYGYRLRQLSLTAAQ